MMVNKYAIQLCRTPVQYSVTALMNTALNKGIVARSVSIASNYAALGVHLFPIYCCSSFAKTTLIVCCISARRAIAQITHTKWIL